MKKLPLMKLHCRVNPDTHELEAHIYRFAGTRTDRDIKRMTAKICEEFLELDSDSMYNFRAYGHHTGFEDNTLEWSIDLYSTEKKDESH